MFRSLEHYGMPVVGESPDFVVYFDGMYRFAVYREDLERWEDTLTDCIPGYTSGFCTHVTGIGDPVVLRRVMEECDLNFVSAAGTSRTFSK